MAILIKASGEEISDAAELHALAQALGLTTEHVAIPPTLSEALAPEGLNETARETTLAAFPLRPPYKARDIVILSPSTPNIDAMAATFADWHVHDDDEVRLVLDGEGVFGLVTPDGLADLHVAPGDLIGVPAGFEHNFRLTAARRIKALRYFNDSAGWAARFTHRAA